MPSETEPEPAATALDAFGVERLSDLDADAEDIARTLAGDGGGEDDAAEEEDHEKEEDREMEEDQGEEEEDQED